MKSLILSFAAVCFVSCLSFAQQSFRVQYEQEVKLDIKGKSDDPKAQAFFQNMPKSTKSDFELLYDGEASLYQNIIKKENPNAAKKFFWGGGKTPDIYYHNFKTGKNLHQQDFFRKTFLVEGELEKRKWKMTKEQRTINGYLCYQAMAGDSTDRVVVWFTPQIPTTAAPQFLEGLPGLILAAVFGEKENRILVAKDIQLGELKTEITAPKEGKKVSKKKYDKIVEKKKQEMKERFGGKRNKGGHSIIIIE